MAPHLGCGPHLPEIPGPLLSKDFVSIAWITPHPLTHPTPAQGLSKCKFVSKRIDLFLFSGLVGHRQCFAFWWRHGFVFFWESSSMLSHQKGEHRKGRAASCWLRCCVQEVLTVNSELASSCGMVSQATQPVTVSLFQSWLRLLENSVHY